MLPMPPVTDQREQRDAHNDRLAYLEEARTSNSWIGILTLLIVLATLILVGSLLLGGGDAAPDDGPIPTVEDPIPTEPTVDPGGQA